MQLPWVQDRFDPTGRRWRVLTGLEDDARKYVRLRRGQREHQTERCNGLLRSGMNMYVLWQVRSGKKRLHPMHWSRVIDFSLGRWQTAD